jgi:regulatory protein
MNKKGFVTFNEAVSKAQHYCAYQERSHRELRSKLHELGVFSEDAEVIITKMIEQGYLNEERYAKAFAGGKFRTKKWGRNRIRMELKHEQVSDYCITQAMKEIDDKSYRKTLLELLEKKGRLLSEKNPAIRRNKLAAFVIGKGFEPELAWEAVNEFI